MFVCEKCHERDRIVTKCRLGFKLHTVAVLGHCHICGKRSSNLKWCDLYKKEKRPTCLSAKDVTSMIE